MAEKAPLEKVKNANEMMSFLFCTKTLSRLENENKIVARALL
jgi:hypothetical protein